VSSTAGDILVNLRDALRASGLFAEVSIGPAVDTGKFPRAELHLSAVKETVPDDNPAARWLMLRARLAITVRGAGAEQLRAWELAEAAGAALLADRFRGQRCRDLPTGRATELGVAELSPHAKPPLAEVSFEIRCNLELEANP
jgi:hypothetical protein